MKRIMQINDVRMEECCMKLKQKLNEALQFALYADSNDERIPEWIRSEYRRSDQQLIDALKYLGEAWPFRLLESFSMKKEERIYIRYLKNRLQIEDIPKFDPSIERSFFSSAREERLHHFCPGYYRFLLPYLPTNMGMVKEESGHYKVDNVWVDIHVGRIEDLKEGRLATVLITDPNGGGFANFVEDICTQIRNSFFPSIFQDECMLEEKHIRWIDVQGTIFDWHKWTADKLVWHKEKRRYSWPNTEWERFPQDDWCYMECLQHFRNKANIACQVIDQERGYLRKDAPHWVVDMYHDVLYHTLSYDRDSKSVLKDISYVLQDLSEDRMVSVYGYLEKIIYKHIYRQKPIYKKEKYVEEYDIEKAFESIKQNQPTYQQTT